MLSLGRSGGADGAGMGWAMTASGSGQPAVSANGWNTRLYWLWIWYNAIAFVTVLTAGFLLALLSSNVLHLSLASGHVVVALPAQPEPA